MSPEEIPLTIRTTVENLIASIGNRGVSSVVSDSLDPSSAATPETVKALSRPTTRCPIG